MRRARAASLLAPARTLAACVAVAGRDFGRAFFSIWLDRRTAAPALRDALLGDAAAQDAQQRRRDR